MHKRMCPCTFELFCEPFIFTNNVKLVAKSEFLIKICLRHIGANLKQTQTPIYNMEGR